MERRLAAILAADMVGYSRLMATAEAETLTRQRELRQQLIDPKIAEYGGRIFKSTGDGVLVEFPSVVDALCCAVSIQLAMPEREATEREEHRIAYRVGINLGDIIIEDNDVYGDGVNVAARLEALADPGGILVSRTVVDHVDGKVASTFEDMGPQQVKNIPDPVHVFRVLMKPEAPGDAVPRAARAKPRVRPYIGLAALIAAVIGLAIWQPWTSVEPPASVERMAFALPDKPSIAVLPFDNISDDVEQEYFADGMTEDLITDLSKISGLFVIARNSTFGYKGTAVEIRQVAEDLGVRYVLEGSVRRVEDQVRINAQLIDALTGYHIWADRYDGPVDNVFGLQDQVIEKIVAALAINLSGDETVGTGRADTASPEAYDAYLRGLAHYHRQTPQDHAKAIEYFNTAVELDPDFSQAHARLAAIYWFAYDTKWDVHLGIEYEAGDLAREHLAKALVLPNADAYRVSVQILMAEGQNGKALEQIEEAIALEPNNADSYGTKAWILTMSGRAPEAEENVKTAMRLNPDYGPDYLRELGRALFYQKRHEEAVAALQRAVELSPRYEFAYRLLAATYGHLGRNEEAAAAIAKYNELTEPTIGEPLTISRVETLLGGDWYDLDRAYLGHLLDGLRKAGVPEGRPTGVTAANYEDLVTRNGATFDVEGAIKIDATGVKALFDQGAVIIDSRGNGPYRRGHIPGAVNIPLNDLTQENLADLAAPDRELVFYCGGEDCSLSAKSCAKALVWGHSRVFYFAEGYPAWKEKGYDIATDQ